MVIGLESTHSSPEEWSRASINHRFTSTCPGDDRIGFQFPANLTASTRPSVHATSRLIESARSAFLRSREQASDRAALAIFRGIERALLDLEHALRANAHRGEN